jgi:hypothetical protein
VGGISAEGKDIVAALLETKNAFTGVRSGLQCLGEKAGVPVSSRTSPLPFGYL